jgi:Tfp pilus assembly protein PilW
MRRVLRVLRRDDGISIIELVIVSAIGLVILGAVLSLLESGTKTERATQARDTALTALRQAESAIDKDLRQAIPPIAATSTASSLDIQTYIAGSQHHVVYAVASGTLTRTLDGATPVVLATHVTSTAPFCYDYDTVANTCAGGPPTSATRVVHVELAATPDVFSGGPITLATDIELRNPGQ